MSTMTALAPAARNGKKQAPGDKESKRKEGDSLDAKKLQRYSNGSGGSIKPPPIVNEVLRSPGRPLDPVTRAYMEPRFGVNFGQVRVHNDAKASASARAVNAQAYTVGSHIVFDSGRYAPNHSQGQRLLAHELSHTVQQAGREITSPLLKQKAFAGAISEHTLEREADVAANAIVNGGTVAPPIKARSALQVQRAPNDPALQNNSDPQNNSSPQNNSNAQNNASPAGTGDPGTGTGTGTGTPGSGSKLAFEFDAFIPGTLGKAYSDYDYPHDLKNQAAFETDVKAVTGTWLPEPGTFTGLNTGPWVYATDNRGFGGGSHRVGFTGTIDPADIGSLTSKPNAFTHDTTGSEHVRWKHTGNVTSSGETGSLEGPVSAKAPVGSSETHADDSTTASTVTTKGHCAYPFKAVSPDIDYKLIFNLRKDSSGKTAVKFNIENNMFPYYELLINGGSVWTYTSSSTGPGVVNLNRSVSFQSGDWFF